MLICISQLDRKDMLLQPFSFCCFLSFLSPSSFFSSPFLFLFFFFSSSFFSLISPVGTWFSFRWPPFKDIMISKWVVTEKKDQCGLPKVNSRLGFLGFAIDELNSDILSQLKRFGSMSFCNRDKLKNKSNNKLLKECGCIREVCLGGNQRTVAL